MHRVWQRDVPSSRGCGRDLRRPALASRRRRARGGVRPRRAAVGLGCPAGPDVDAFEREVAARVGVARTQWRSRSGTAALHLALVSWGVGPGDVVPVSTLTFAATATRSATPARAVVRRLRARRPATSTRAARPGARAAARRGSAGARVSSRSTCSASAWTTTRIDRRSRRVTAFACWPTPRSRWGRVAAAAQRGSFGDAAVLSFNGNKMMTTSGGGMLLTDDADLARARAHSCRPRPGSR